jgi:hypothetical protein
MASRSKTGKGKRILWILAGAVAVMAAIQLVPYGRNHSAMPAPHPFQWKSPEAESLARAACYDCHSNETRWWWAVKVAPFSWLAQSDIDEAKHRVNFSDWNVKPITVQQLDRSLHRGMPPLQFTIVHPDAKLTEAQKQTMIQGFQASLASNGAMGASGSAGQTPEELIQARCSDCHSPSKALRFRASSPQEAKALIDNMIGKGATVSATEAQTMVSYFTR